MKTIKDATLTIHTQETIITGHLNELAIRRDCESERDQVRISEAALVEAQRKLQ